MRALALAVLVLVLAGCAQDGPDLKEVAQACSIPPDPEGQSIAALDATDEELDCLFTELETSSDVVVRVRQMPTGEESSDGLRYSWQPGLETLDLIVSR